MSSLQKRVRAAKVGLLFSAVFGAFVLPTRAQEAPPEVRAAPPNERKPGAAFAKALKPRPVTLADALAKADLGRVGLALAVNAGRETLTERQALDLDLSTVNRAVAAYHRASRDFGEVMAIGPPTYTELLTDFSKGNAFADMPPPQAFTLLMAALDDRQRSALMSKDGLGTGDLTPMQKQLFEALLPDAEVTAKPRSAANGNPIRLGNLREKAGSVRLRMAQEVTLRADVKNDKYARATVPLLTGAGDAKFYDLSSNRVYTHLAKVNGVVIRRDVPNRLKPSDLNYNAPALQAVIPISDLKTVGDLIKSVAKKTGVELYCDPCYEKQILTWAASGRTTASASELLRALAFCVAGTYRRVGTAFTLTEDLIGVGTRRQMIHDFEEECDAERHQAVHEAETKIKANPAQKSRQVGGFDDPLAMTAEQEKAPPEKDNYTNFFIDGYESLASASLPFDKLTPTQQQAVRSFERAQANLKPTTPPRREPDFEKNIHVVKRLSAQMLISGLEGVVATDFGTELNGLFQPESPPYKTPESELAHYRNLPKWTDAAKAYARRAVICKPHTTADVDASLIRITALGSTRCG